LQDDIVFRTDGRHSNMVFYVGGLTVTIIDPDHVTAARGLRSGDPVFVQGHLISDVTVNALHERYRQTTIVVDEIGLLILITEPQARSDFKRPNTLTR